jgi:hypothetical protein
MQTFPAQQTNLCFRAGNSRINRTLALARILAFLATILKPPARAQDELLARYQGHSLCDPTARKPGRVIADRITRR